MNEKVEIHEQKTSLGDEVSPPARLIPDDNSLPLVAESNSVPNNHRAAAPAEPLVQNEGLEDTFL